MDLEKLEREARGKSALQAAAESPEGRRLAETLDEKALRDAVRRGDSAALKKLLTAALSTPDGRALAAQVKKAVGKSE